MKFLHSLMLTLGIALVAISVVSVDSTAMAIDAGKCRDKECTDCVGKDEGESCNHAPGKGCVCTCQSKKCQA